jgi:peptide/nickel transport system permease protein
VIVLVAVVGPFLAPRSPTTFVGAPFAAPSQGVPLGTDYLGRDVLSRFLAGGYRLLLISGLSAMVGVGVGTIVGLTAGYSKTWRGQIGMRALDVLLAFPNIVLVLLFISLVGPKIWLIVALVGIAQAPRVARVMRAATIEVVERDFVLAAEALGVPKWRILLEEVLPNVTGPLMVEWGLRLTYAIGVVSALSFLGFGRFTTTDARLGSDGE